MNEIQAVLDLKNVQNYQEIATILGKFKHESWESIVNKILDDKQPDVNPISIRLVCNFVLNKINLQSTQNKIQKNFPELFVSI